MNSMAADMKLSDLAEAIRRAAAFVPKLERQMQKPSILGLSLVA
jgi:hypothetical protein